MNRTEIIIEVCASSVEDVLVAGLCGAHRIELNSGLPLGGLTPSIGLVQVAKQMTKLPIIAMVRPRESGFLYSEHEFNVLRRDIDHVVGMGVVGIAVGLLDGERRIDQRRAELLRQQTPNIELVFHRAFDLTHDWRQALDDLVQLGFDRIMTSGRRSSALQGVELIAKMVELANNRIEILPAGGITAENAATILAVAGVSQLHGSFSTTSRDDTAASELSFTSMAADAAEFRRTSSESLKNLIKSLAASSSPEL